MDFVSPCTTVDGVRTGTAQKHIVPIVAKNDVVTTLVEQVIAIKGCIVFIALCWSRPNGYAAAITKDIVLTVTTDNKIIAETAENIIFPAICNNYVVPIALVRRIGFGNSLVCTSLKSSSFTENEAGPGFRTLDYVIAVIAINQGILTTCKFKTT